MEYGQFYQAYKEWLDKKYTAGVPMEDEIKAIRDEDTGYNYAGSGVTSDSGDIHVQELNCVKK